MVLLKSNGKESIVIAFSGLFFDPLRGTSEGGRYEDASITFFVLDLRQRSVGPNSGASQPVVRKGGAGSAMCQSDQALRRWPPLIMSSFPSLYGREHSNPIWFRHLLPTQWRGGQRLAWQRRHRLWANSASANGASFCERRSTTALLASQGDGHSPAGASCKRSGRRCWQSLASQRHATSTLTLK